MVQMARFLLAQAPTGSRLVRNRCKMILINFRYHPILWKFALKCIPGGGGAPVLPLVVGGHISEVHRWIWKFLPFFHLGDLPEHLESGLVDKGIFVNLKSHLAAQWWVLIFGVNCIKVHHIFNSFLVYLWTLLQHGRLKGNGHLKSLPLKFNSLILNALKIAKQWKPLYQNFDQKVFFWTRRKFL